LQQEISNSNFIPGLEIKKTRKLPAEEIEECSIKPGFITTILLKLFVESLFTKFLSPFFFLQKDLFGWNMPVARFAYESLPAPLFSSIGVELFCANSLEIADMIDFWEVAGRIDEKLRSTGGC